MLYNYASGFDARAQQRKLDTAYRLAGATIPTNFEDTRKIILAAPSVHDIAQRLAYEAYETDTPEKLVKKAIADIREAMAGEALKDAFLKAEGTAAVGAINRLIDRGVEDVQGAFDKTAQTLTEAATHLDPHRPLEAETAVALDAGAHLTTARDTLPKLSTYASMHSLPGRGTSAPSKLCQLLPIISLPDIVQEEIYIGPSATDRTVNKNAITGTLTVRKLGRDAQSNIDNAIIGIARGEYEGITFDLGTRTEVHNRGLAMKLVYTKKQVHDKRASFGI